MFLVHLHPGWRTDVHWPLSSAEVAAWYTVEEAYEERDAAI